MYFGTLGCHHIFQRRRNEGWGNRYSNGRYENVQRKTTVWKVLHYPFVTITLWVLIPLKLHDADTTE